MPSRLRCLTACAMAATIVAGAACGSDDNNTAPLVATNLAINGASAVTGVAGLALTNPLSVHVSDQEGNAVANATVSWAVTFGGGSVSAPSTETDVDGNATVVWTLGPAVGADTVKASIANGASVKIAAVGSGGAVTALLKAGGDNQTVAVGSTAAPVVVLATDSFGNPVANATVTWAVQGGGTLSSTSTTTDATGHTQTTLTLGATAGTYAITAGAGTAVTTFTIMGQ